MGKNIRVYLVPWDRRWQLVELVGSFKNSVASLLQVACICLGLVYRFLVNFFDMMVGGGRWK